MVTHYANGTTWVCQTTRLFTHPWCRHFTSRLFLERLEELVQRFRHLGEDLKTTVLADIHQKHTGGKFAPHFPP